MDKVHYEEMVKAIDGLTAHCCRTEKFMCVGIVMPQRSLSIC